VPCVTESRRFFFRERRNVPAILVLNTLQTRSARTDQQRSVALLPRAFDAESSTEPLVSNRFPDQEQSDFWFQ
jgi:hypothetical protein